MKKGVFILVFLIIIVLLFGSVYALIDISDKKSFSEISKDKNFLISDKEDIKYQGYIVRLKEPSISEKLKSIDKTGLGGKEKFNVLSDYKTELELEHISSLGEIGEELQIKEELSSLSFFERIIKFFRNLFYFTNGNNPLGFVARLTGFSISDSSETGLKPDFEYYYIFNGFSLKGISDEQALQIRGLGYEVYPNYEVHIDLDKSTEVINAVSARAGFNASGEGVVIAIIDTGIDATHESLDDLDDDSSTNDPKVIGFKDYINFRNNPYDDFGHGTHVAGIAAGTGGGTPYIGVAPKAKLVGVKVLDNYGSGTFDQVIAGMEWTAQNKDVYNISIISMSLGANYNSDGTTPVEIAADSAVDMGINVVVAAGNAGSFGKKTVGIPACAKKAITVGAVDNNKVIASFSSRGPTKDGRIKPEVSAPGVNVYSSVPKGNCYLCDSSGYMALSGTSMATPHVSGLIALILSKDKSLSPSDIRNILLNTSEDKGDFGPDNDYGWGVVDAFASLIYITPLSHELGISNYEASSWAGLNQETIIKLNIKNYGENNENNVMAKLSVDGVLKESKTIPLIETKKSAEVSFSIIFNEIGDKKISLEIEPVNGESIISNNQKNFSIDAIEVLGTIKAVVVDSWGNDKAEYTIFKDLNENWFNYGEYAVNIDYNTLNKEDISYEDIKATNADVLILSDAWDNGGYTGFNWEYTDSEILAIKKYVEEGHGIIGTSGTLSTDYTPNNMKLAPLFGLDALSPATWSAGFRNPLSLLVEDDILLKNISNPYRTGQYMTVFDLNADKSLSPIIVADSNDGAYVSAFKPKLGASIYFTPIIEYYVANEQDKQFFYNALIWTKLNTGESDHDLSISNLEIPKPVVIGSQVEIKAKLANKGKENENAIVRLLIDNVEKDNFKAALISGEEINISFNWNPLETGYHDVSLNVNKVYGENYGLNNVVRKKINIGGAKLNNYFNDYGIDINSDGKFEFLGIEIGVDVLERGYYNIDYLLTSKFGVELYSYSEGFYLNEGDNNITLKIPGSKIREWDLNGPYILKALTLGNSDGVLEEREDVYETYAYKVSDFIFGADLNCNIDIDTLLVNISNVISIEVENIGKINASDINVSLYKRCYDEEEDYILLGSELISYLDPNEISSPEILWNPNNIGECYLKCIVNSSEDINLENNEYEDHVRIIRDAADISLGFYINNYNILVNNPNTISLFLENEGFRSSGNINYILYDFYNYSDYYFNFNDSYYLNFENIDYTITAFKIDSENIRIQVNYSGLSNDYFLSGINPAIEINADVYLGVGYFGSQGINFVIGKKDILFSGNNPRLSEGEEFHTDINFIPTKLGRHLILGFANITSDGYLKNNFYANGFRVLENGADLEGYIYYLEDVKVNEEKTIRTNIWNDGFEDTINGTAELYYCNNCPDNLTLIDEKDILINAGDNIELNFDWTPNKIGWHRLYLILNATNEINPENNIESTWFQVLGKGPDLSINFDSGQDTLYKEQNNNIRLIIENVGSEISNDSVVGLYYFKEEMSQYELISEQAINSLDPNEIRNLVFNWTPDIKGSVDLMAVISSNGDVNNVNDENYINSVILNNGLDVAIENSYLPNEAIINKPGRISSIVTNVGDRSAFFALKLYVNGVLKNSSDINGLLAGEKQVLEFYWTPENLNNNALEINAELIGDIDNSDNVISGNVNVFNLKNTNIAVIDSANSNADRFIFIDDNIEEKVYNTTSVNPVNTEYADKSVDLIIVNKIGTLVAGGILYKNRSLGQNERIVSDYYSKLVQDKPYYFVFANKPTFDFNETEIALILDKDYLIDLGINTSFDELTFYYCKDFDFINKICLEWIEPDDLSLDYSYDERGYPISLVFEAAGEKIEAIAFAEKNDFDGETTNFTSAPDLAWLKLERLRHGKIEFLSKVDITRIRNLLYNNPIYLRKNVKINHAKISLNSQELQLPNINTKLVFKNINFRNPIVLYNRATCPTNICSNIVFDSNKGILSVNVNSFSDFEVIEGVGCGDNICQSGESCSNCVSDCGQCTSTRGSPGGGGPGGGNTRVGVAPRNCTPRWNCNWGLCQNNLQNWICNDINNCGTNIGKPEDSKACFIESNCIDNDKDGYGVGPDCLGLDLDDNDPGITNVPKPGIEKGIKISPIFIITASFLLIMIIIILIILSLVYFKENKNRTKRNILMDEGKKLVGQMRYKGLSDDSIKNLFRQKGWKEKDIEEILKIY